MLDSLGCVVFLEITMGQLGHSATRNRTIPEMIPGVGDIIQIFCEGHSSILKNSEQQVFVFGFNQSGQLGHSFSC